MRKLDADMGSTSDQASINLAGVRTAQAKAQGVSKIDGVAISRDGTRTMAVGSHDMQQRLVDIGTVQAVHTSVESSSKAIQALASQAAPAHVNQQPHQTAIPDPRTVAHVH